MGLSAGAGEFTKHRSMLIPVVGDAVRETAWGEVCRQAAASAL